MPVQPQDPNATASRHLPFADDGYVVIPRPLVDAMPDAWQAAARALLSELARAYAGAATPGAYTVQACEEVPLSRLTDADLRTLGLSVSFGCQERDHFHCMSDTCDAGTIYVDGAGRQLAPTTLVRVPVSAPAAGNADAAQPRLDLPRDDQAALVVHLQRAGDVAAYFQSLVADARDCAATSHVDGDLAAAVIELAPAVRTTVTHWHSLVEVADGPRSATRQ